MLRQLFSVLCVVSMLTFVGCDAGGPAEFDPSSVEAETEAETSAQEQYGDDYNKSMQENYKQ